MSLVLSLGLVAGSPGSAQAAPLPVADVRAGHRTGPATAWLSKVRGCNRYVSKRGDDTTGTSMSTAWRTVGKAMRELKPGQTACVRSGTYTEAPMRAVSSGTATRPIGLKAYPGEKPVIRASQDGSLFDFQRSGARLGYWLLQGLTIDKRRRDGASVRIEGDRLTATDSTLVSHIVIRSNTIRNGKSGGAILVRNRVTDVLLRGNTIEDHHRFEYWRNYRQPGAQRLRVDYADAELPATSPGPDGSTLSYGRADAHGVSIESESRFTDRPSVQRIRIQSNRLLDNGGDGVQCIGADDGSGLDHISDAGDIDLVDNRAANNAEEAVDIKSCQWISIRGSVSPGRPTEKKAAANRFSTSKPTDRSRDLQLSPTNGNFGGGGLVVLHWNARHVRIENSRLSGACQGIAVGRAEVPVRNLVIRRVLVSSMTSATSSRCLSDRSTGIALRLDRVERADLYHNTFVMPAGSKAAAISVGTTLGVPDPAQGPFLRDIDLWNNIVQAPRWLGLALRLRITSTGPDYDWTSGFVSDRNLYYNPAAAPPPHHPGFILSPPPSYRLVALPLARNTTPPTPADPNWRDATSLDTTSVERKPLFVAKPTTNDYYTTRKSPARNRAMAIPGYGVPKCPGSPTTNRADIGFRESC